MLYSQSPRNIRPVSQGLARVGYPVLVFSLPFLLGLATAHATIVAAKATAPNQSLTKKTANTGVALSETAPNEAALNEAVSAATVAAKIPVSAIQPQGDGQPGDKRIEQQQEQDSQGGDKSALTANVDDTSPENLESLERSESLDNLESPKSWDAAQRPTTTANLAAAEWQQAPAATPPPEDNRLEPVSDAASARQKNLQKLASFYRPKDDLALPQLPHSLDNGVANDLDNGVDNPLENSVSGVAITEQVIDANQAAPVAVPKVFNRASNHLSSHRCEGVWITSNPLTSSTLTSNVQTDASNDRGSSDYLSSDNLSNDYAQAIARAKQQDGLSLANGLPLYAIADYAYYDSQNYVELLGNVAVVQNGQRISSEKMTLDLQSGIAGMQGDILLTQAPDLSPASASLSLQAAKGVDSRLTNRQTSVNPQKPQDEAALGAGLIIVANDMAYDTTNNQATAHEVAFASATLQAHGYAQKLNKPDASHLELDNVMFSTCPPTDRQWQLEAKQIDIDANTGRGEAYAATFRLKGVPVFYLPYFNFPIDARRGSGFLTPSASISSDNGVKISVPYYLNLAPNYDATLTTNVYSNRNPMLVGELRYLTQGYGEGALTTAYLPSDKEYNDQDRHGFFYQHLWTAQDMPQLSASAVYNYVSDPDYLDDFEGFDSFGLANSQINLPRRAQINYYNDYIDTQLKVETFQSLSAVDANGVAVEDKDKPYSRLPQLAINYRLPPINTALNTVVINGRHNSAYFKKSILDGSENEKSGLRVFNDIAASYPIQRTWGHLTPKLSLQHLYTAYDEKSRSANGVSQQDNSQSVFVPQFSVDSALNFYQPGSPFGWFDNVLGGYQLLTPRLKYSYAPFKDQTSIPNFDTRIASVDYNQLFADSWFLGYDRLPDSNNLSLGINYRYLDALGVTRFDGSIGDQFYLQHNKVGLDNSPANRASKAPTLNAATANSTANSNANSNQVFSDTSSGVAWQASMQPYRNVWFDFNGALSSDNDLNFINSQIRYQPTPASLFNLGFIKRNADSNTNQRQLSAITASTLLPIDSNWRVMAQGQFDDRNNRVIDATLGLDYEDCCYGFSIYGRSYYNDLNLEDKPTHAVMAEFRINGLGNSNSRFSKLLSDKVVGFEPVDTLWHK